MVKFDIYNHELDRYLMGHDILYRLKPYEILFVNEMTRHNMTQRFIIVALKDRDPNNLTSIMSVYKARSTYQSTIRGPFKKMQHLLKLIYDEKYMCWIRQKEESYVIDDIF